MHTADASSMDLPRFLAACAERQGRFANQILAMVVGRWAGAYAVCTGDGGRRYHLPRRCPRSSRSKQLVLPGRWSSALTKP